MELGQLGVAGGGVDEGGEDVADVGPVEELHEVPQQHGEVLAERVAFGFDVRSLQRRERGVDQPCA